MKRLLICLITTGSISFGLAQSSSLCTKSLNDAEVAFEQGRLSDIINDAENTGTFKACLETDVFSIQEKIRAYKLLTKAYLFQDNEVKAEEMFTKLLRVDKEHQLSPEDPAELYLLRDKFKTEPIFRIAFRGGVNKSLPFVIQRFNTTGDKRYNEQGNNTGLGIGFWGEALAEYHISKGVEVAAGFQYRIMSYEIEGELIDGNLSYLASNTNNSLRFPLLVRYSLNYNEKNADGKRKGLLPYAFLGGSFDYVLNARYVDAQRTGGTAYTLPDESISLTDADQVQRSNLSIMAGVGVRLRTGRSRVDFFSFELRYDNALFNYINPDNRWENKDLNFGIGHVEDDLALNALSFSVGYTRSLYAPKKRKQYR